MDQETRRAVSLFRFGIISPLVSRKGMSRGEQEARIRQIVEATWELPGSTRSSIARSTVLRWLSLYQRSGDQLESLEPQPRKDRNESRALDRELQASLIALRKENLGVSLPVFVLLFGLLAINIAFLYFDIKITDETKEIAAGKLGPKEIIDHVVLLGEPLVFTKANIDQYQF